jgi:hypothetical protein
VGAPYRRIGVEFKMKKKRKDKGEDEKIKG